MDSATASEGAPPNRSVTPLKIVVAGAFGVGKTTFVGAASDIVPLRTEEVMTAPSEATDDLSGTPDKRTTTVAMDFGRLDLDDGERPPNGGSRHRSADGPDGDDLVLYLFGTPGQYRFWFMWDELVRGALGVVVLVDTRRLIDSFPVLDYFDRTDLPVLIAVNGFDGEFPHGVDDVREALAIGDDRPVVTCDARDRRSTTEALATLVEHALRVRDGDTGREPQRLDAYVERGEPATGAAR